MAIGELKINIIDVGQGQCTFVEIYDDDGMNPQLLYTLLFDCGSDKTSNATTTNLDYVVNKALKRSPPGFDAIFFSHSDSDHISLAYYVLSQVIAKCPTSTKPTVNRVWYGGNFALYTKHGFNILNYISNSKLCASSDIKNFNANSTDYDTSLKRFAYHIWTSGGGDDRVSVNALVANVISDDPDWDDNTAWFTTKTAEEKNRVSLIACLRFKGTVYVICGDATSKTMGACNGLLKDGTTVFDSNSMTTLPHHGSRATGFAVKSGAVASTTAVNIVKTFSANMKSKTISVSAFQKHRHPSMQLMNEFIPTVTTPLVKDPRLKQANSHRVTAQVDIDLGAPSGLIIFKSNDYSFETLINTFSTFYFDGSTTFSYQLGTTTVAKSDGLAVTGTSINQHACWQYIVAESGAFSIKGFADMSKAAFTETVTGSTAFLAEDNTLKLPSCVPTYTVRSKIPAKATRTVPASDRLFESRLKQFQR